MSKTIPIITYYLKESLDLAEFAKKGDSLPFFSLLRKERNLLLFSMGENRYICAFPYGAVVLFGFTEQKEIDKVLKLLAEDTEEADSAAKPKEMIAPDDYQCLVDAECAVGADLETVRVKELEPDTITLIAQILAQSIVLDVLDRRIDGTMGFFDQVYSHLSKHGKMHTGTKKALKAIGTSGNATLFAINRLALLDKPDTAWADTASQALYENMRKAYELEDRFASLQLKLDFIRSSSEAVLDTMSTRRAEMLEMIIIVLIAIEILFALTGVYG